MKTSFRCVSCVSSSCSFPLKGSLSSSSMSVGFHASPSASFASSPSLGRHATSLMPFSSTYLLRSVSGSCSGRSSSSFLVGGGGTHVRHMATDPQARWLERINSIGMVVEPYEMPKPPQPIMSWFTPAGWSERATRMRSAWFNNTALFTLWRRLPGGFADRQFKLTVLESYSEIYRAIARGNLAPVRRLITDKQYEKIIKEIQARRGRGVPPLVWNADYESSDAPWGACSIVRARAMPIIPGRIDTTYAQLTVRVASKHRVLPAPKATARHAKGVDSGVDSAAAASAAAVETFVEDFWVFEIAVGDAVRSKENSRWRLLERLTL